MYIHASSAIVRQNAVFGSLNGIKCYSGSLIWTEEVNSGWWDRGENALTGNSYGLVSDGNSTAIFGRADYVGADTYYYGACNSLFSNAVYDAMATSGSVIEARANYWGQYPPNLSKINGAVFYDPASQYPGDCDPDYGGGGCELCLTASQNSENAVDELNEALKAFGRRGYNLAKSFYLAAMANADSPEETMRALSGLYHTYSAGGDEGIFTLIARLASEPSARGYYASELLARMQTAKGDFDAAVKTLNSLKAAAAGTDHEKQALIQLAFLKEYSDRYSSVSGQAIDELISKFGNSVDAGLLAALGVSSTNKNASLADAQTTRTEGNLSVFPNPFNPTTRFQFIVNEAAFVSLKVYDMLGREVALLIHEQKQLGTHHVRWDASAQPSGIYFARLDIAGSAFVRKLLLVK